MLMVWLIGCKTKIAQHIIFLLNIAMHKLSLNPSNLVLLGEY